MLLTTIVLHLPRSHNIFLLCFISTTFLVLQFDIKSYVCEECDIVNLGLLCLSLAFYIMFWSLSAFLSLQLFFHNISLPQPSPESLFYIRFNFGHRLLTHKGENKYVCDECDFLFTSTFFHFNPWVITVFCAYYFVGAKTFRLCCFLSVSFDGRPSTIPSILGGILPWS